MLKLNGNDIYRETEKIGWIEGNHIFAHDGKKLGYYDDAHVYDYNADKVAYVDGDVLYDHEGNPKAHLEVVTESIEGVLPTVGKCAVYVLIGV